MSLCNHISSYFKELSMLLVCRVSLVDANYDSMSLCRHTTSYFKIVTVLVVCYLSSGADGSLPHALVNIKLHTLNQVSM